MALDGCGSGVDRPRPISIALGVCSTADSCDRSERLIGAAFLTDASDAACPVVAAVGAGAMLVAAASDTIVLADEGRAGAATRSRRTTKLPSATTSTAAAARHIGQFLTLRRCAMGMTP